MPHPTSRLRGGTKDKYVLGANTVCQRNDIYHGSNTRDREFGPGQLGPKQGKNNGFVFLVEKEVTILRSAG